MAGIFSILASAAVDIFEIATGEEPEVDSPAHNSDLERVQQMLIKQKKLETLRKAQRQESQEKVIKIAVITGVGIMAFISLKG